MTVTGTFTQSFEDLALLSIAVTVLVVISSEQEQSLLKDSRFWFVAGTLMYNLGVLPFLALANQFLPYSVSDLEKVWSIPWILQILLNGMYGVAFLMAPRDRTVMRTSV